MPGPATDRRDAVPRVSRPLLAFFRYVVRRYFRRQFHGVRLSGAHHARSVSGPLIVYANHSSWWDPMVAFLLADELFAERQHYAPMDASALRRYPILKRLGIFPVEIETARGAIQFLRTGQKILQSGGVLWITPQGQFSDPRVRPLLFKPGLAALAGRSGGCTLLPLAIEYPFWNERLPETLLHFGEPVHVSAESASTLEPRLIAALEATMNALREKTLTRHADAFEQTLSFNPGGAGGFYALAQRLKSLALRRPYRAEHTPTRHEPAPQ